MAASRRPPAVARVLTRITATVREHAMFDPGDLVLVWVSGGPDSVCLLESLVRLRRLFRIRLAVFHLDHGLREGSAADAAYVRRLAARNGLPFHLRHATPLPVDGASVELWARYQRALAAGSVAEEIGATRWADGHTMDDQAETVLMGLVLGWGPEGMTGIAPANGVLVRPMLDVTREEVEAFCRALGLRPRRDPTNDDTRLLRNAIRLEAIPAIERATGRRVTQTFARTATLFGREGQALYELAAERLDRVMASRPGGFELAAAPLLDMPEALAARVVRRAFQRADIGWDSAAIDAVLDLARGRPGRRADVVAGSTARRTRGSVVIEGRSMTSRRSDTRRG
jgi:tRNA(Ile)-lysidine synthase